jgi:hypothetical protein
MYKNTYFCTVSRYHLKGGITRYVLPLPSLPPFWSYTVYQFPQIVRGHLVRSNWEGSMRLVGEKLAHRACRRTVPLGDRGARRRRTTGAAGRGAHRRERTRKWVRTAGSPRAQRAERSCCVGVEFRSRTSQAGGRGSRRRRRAVRNGGELGGGVRPHTACR